MLFCLGTHQPLWVDAHIALRATHQYLALCRAYHGITVEEELRYAHTGQETASYNLQFARMAQELNSHHAATGRTHPVHPVSVPSHTLDDVVRATDVVECVPLCVKNGDAVGVGEQHHALLLVGLHVRHHLVHPLLSTFPVAEGYAARAVAEFVGPESIYRSQIHGACTIITNGVHLYIAALFVGNDMRSFVLRVKDDGLANRR